MASKPGRRAERPLTLKQLQAELSRKKAPWIAGDSAVAQLPDSDQRARLGLRTSPAALAAIRALTSAANAANAFESAATLPPNIDWRSNNGNYVTSIRDQKTCGSCVAFATLATIESRANIECHTAGQARDYSEAFLFYCGCGNCCETGWNFAPALQFCKTRGVALEGDFPYAPGNQPCRSGVVPQFNIASYTTAASTFDRKTAIAERGPVVAGMAVYRDFFSYQSGIYRHISGDLAGYHAISVIGYNDADGCWICKNSWGTDWGEAGFFRIAYGEAEIDTAFLFYEPVVPCPAKATLGDPVFDELMRVMQKHPGLKITISC